MIDDCGVAEGRYSGISRQARVWVDLAGVLGPDLWIASRVKKFIKGGGPEMGDGEVQRRLKFV